MPSHFRRSAPSPETIRPRRRATLLTGTAFSGAFVAAVASHPQPAFAACAGLNTASVTCDAGNPATAGTLATTFAGTTVVNVNTGGKIDTGGASATVTAAGSLTFNNNDTTFGITNGVALLNNFGGIAYLGNAGVSATAGTGLSASGTGPITLTSNATVLSTSGTGISVSTSGIGGILIDGSGSAIGTSSGISASHSGTSGGITISGSGNVAGASFYAISANITNVANASDILIDRAGPVSGLAGLSVQNAGSGKINITGGGLVAVTTGTGILADQSNNVAGTNGSVTVGGTGDINAGVGIYATVSGANNIGGVTVNRSGTITTTGTGIFARTAGGGDVTVTGVGKVTSSVGWAIQALTSGSSGNIVVAPSGALSGAAGIDAEAAGAVTVTAGAVTSTSGNAIYAKGLNGLATVNGQGAINASGGSGISVETGSAGGSGDITVNTTAAGTINATFNGIQAQVVGTAGSINITTAGVIGGGTPVGLAGIDARISSTNPGGGNTVTANADITAAHTGIFASSVGTGETTITGSGNILAGVGIVASQDAFAAGTNAGIHVGGTGTINANIGNGITVAITDANNAGNALVDRSGAVIAVGTGISATSVGGGNVTVAGVGDVVGVTGFGINATTTGGNGNVIVAPTGSVTGVVGINAAAAGSGTVTVTITNALTGTGGIAVQLAGANNSFTMSGPAAALNGSAIGSGSDTFRLNGAGTNTFNVSQIGTGWTLLDKAGTSNWTLAGLASYAGPVTVNGGTLSVNGNLASASSLTVNAGSTLGGTGTVGNTTINGGALAPGNSIGTLTVAGNLVFTAASSYMIEVAATADRTNVTGTATLGGATVKASFAPGASVTKQHTIVNASGGVSGTFASLANTNLPSGFTSSLSYDANNAYLNLALVPVPGSVFSGNQQNVGNAVSNFFNNSNSSIPIAFGALTPAGLTQVSGELGVGSQQTTFDAMGQFMGVMTDPFIAGRGDPVSGGGSPNAYADEESLAYAARGKSRSKSERDAYAAVYRKAPPMAPSFEQRWSVWAAGFGGSQRTDGNTALGSNDTRSSLYGSAVGADYRISPNTLAGFALAGGGTNFSVANNLGGGRSDLFQAGAFIRHNVGPAYLTGALAYGWQDITTDRTVTVAGVDRLRAQFNANAWSGRVEGGYRFVAQGFGLTPYAAGQFTTFQLPAYAEQAIVGSNAFALAYNSRSITDSRSELGLRTDKSLAMQGAILTLRGRAAWAHDFNPDRAIGATFQTLPGASFVVNGARPAANSVLTTASAEMKWINGWSAAATFEGEFSNVTRSYAGKAVVGYAW